MLTIKKCFINRILFCSILVWGFMTLTSCSSPLFVNTEQVDTTSSTQQTPNELPDQSTNLTSIVTSDPTEFPAQDPTKPLNPLSEPPLDTSEQDQENGCASPVSNNSSPLWSKGSLLFHTSQQPAILAISSRGMIPKTVFNLSSNQFLPSAILSSNGQNMAWLNHNSNSDPELVIYDLNTKSEIRIPWNEKWINFLGWSFDGKLKFLLDYDQTLAVGKKYVFELYDVQTGNTEIITETFDLPGYIFDDKNSFGGFASINPVKNLVLYTAFGEEGFDMILRDYMTGEIVWRRENIPSFPVYPMPQWFEDGNEVLFAMPSPAYENTSALIYQLTYDGQLKELPAQPLPLLDQHVFRYLRWSPNKQYIHYGLWKTGTSGPGFVLDSSSGTLREICQPKDDSTFLDGIWIPETNLLIYRVQREDGGLSLRVLDMDSWNAQNLFDAKPDESLTIIGWTPAEFP